MAQFVKVAYTEIGPDVMLPTKVIENNVILETSTLKSQFQGAIGLKYNNSGQWKGLSLMSKGFCPPAEGWGNRKYIVVAESIGQARSIIKGGLASSVSQVFRSRLNQTVTEVQPQPSVIPDTFPLTLRKGKFKSTKKVKKNLEKSVKVVFIQDIEIPAMLTANNVLLEGILNITSEDSEDSIRFKLIEVLQGNIQNGILSSELQFLSCCHKKMTYPCVPTSSQFNFNGIKAVIGQGKLYVKLKGSVRGNIPVDKTDDDVEGEPLFYDLNSTEDDKTTVENIPQTGAPEVGTSIDSEHEKQTDGDDCENITSDTGTPTVSIH